MGGLNTNDNVRLSETSIGRLWVGNFDDAQDQRLAAELLDALTLVSNAELRAGLAGGLASLELEQPVWALPVMAEEDLKSVWSANESATDGGHPRESCSPQGREYHSRPHRPFFDGPFDRIPVGAGSEGLVANFLRDQRERHGWLDPASSVATLRKKRIRTAMVVTDYIGSGRQVIDFVKFLLRNPTLRSWRSGGFIKVVCVTYGATAAGADLVRASGMLDGLEVVKYARSLQDLASGAGRMEEFCLRHTRDRTRADALGYQGMAGLMVFETSVPNTLPWLLRRQPHGDGWFPLFDGPRGRLMPAELLDQVGGRTEQYLVPKGAADGIARTFLANRRNPKPHNRLSYLHHLLALSTISPEPAAIQRWLADVTLNQVEEDLTLLQELGLTKEGRLTAAGTRALQRATHRERRSTALLKGSDESYYPQQLR